MRFQRLDLNLLVALDALLSEKSVSLAADRIFLSQSATSSALGRLRDYFGDELLVVKGRQMILTVRAEELVEPVRAVLDQIRSTISIAPPFDPATSDRLIRLMASDYVTEVLLATALDDIALAAPNMRFEIAPMAEGLSEALDRATVEILITIDYAISPDHPSQFLFEDDYVVIGWAGNPAMAQPMTKELYFELGHVTARFSHARIPAFEDWFVRRQKQQRRVEVTAPSFLTVPSMVVGSNRIATVHRRLAQRLAEYLPLVVHEVPLPIPPIREAIQWHISNKNDRAIQWVVERLVLAAGQKVPSVMDNTVIPFEQGRKDALSHDEITQQWQTTTGPGQRA